LVLGMRAKERGNGIPMRIAPIEAFIEEKKSL
jgi:hypothetical protein